MEATPPAAIEPPIRVALVMICAAILFFAIAAVSVSAAILSAAYRKALL